MNPALLQRLREARTRLAASLLTQRNPEGHWSGELSSSALATATAVTALALVDTPTHKPLLNAGLHWLATHANDDGGWGDTPKSRSNPSTTALAWAAFAATQSDAAFPTTTSRAAAYLNQHLGPAATTTATAIVPAIEALYGDDRTFSVPITMMLALSGRLGPDGWRHIRPLPFELAALPQAVFGALRLPVVSYALPALIAIGQVIHQRSRRFHPLRSLTQHHTLRVLASLQPENGGFLEATPLTSFVTMSLAGMNLAGHPVARKGAAFLRQSVRPDGSWPIDTNLATWVTTLAIKALHHPDSPLDPNSQSTLRDWLLTQQYHRRHPYTGAAPGGWAWTNLPGGVPDADDTSGALLALHLLGPHQPNVLQAALAAVTWLLNLQNSDGGVPTFCRGWGTLPFDRSTPEITAHALRAWTAWSPLLPPNLRERTSSATDRALAFLLKSQRPDGAWIPLWFGNEHAPAQENPVYGTAQVLAALQPLDPRRFADLEPMRHRAAAFLLNTQHPAGTWGGNTGVQASIEESAVAIEALAHRPEFIPHRERTATAFLNLLGPASQPPAAPIGLYFARLWYHERLYPLIFATRALGNLTTPPSP